MASTFRLSLSPGIAAPSLLIFGVALWCDDFVTGVLDCKVPCTYLETLGCFLGPFRLPYTYTSCTTLQIYVLEGYSRCNINADLSNISD